MSFTRRKFIRSLAAGGVLLSSGYGFDALAGEQFFKTPLKFARYRYNNKISYGLVEGRLIRKIKGSPFASYQETVQVRPLSEVAILTPCEPVQALTMGQSYPSRTQHMPVATEALFASPLYKSSNSFLEHEGLIRLPQNANEVHYEGEIVVVIGKEASQVTPETAHEYILGVTCGNDVTARDWQVDGDRCMTAKTSDTFGPIGPYIVSGINYDNLRLRTRLNGVTVQDDRTENLIFDIATLVSIASHQTTLMPQDVIFTGTPGKTGALRPGDVVEVEVDQVGVLRNTAGRFQV